jgi:hypothetical protein
MTKKKASDCCFPLLATNAQCIVDNACNVGGAELQWSEFASSGVKTDVWPLGGIWEELETLSC